MTVFLILIFLNGRYYKKEQIFRDFILGFSLF